MNYLDKFRKFLKKEKAVPIITINEEEIDELIQYYETDDDTNYDTNLLKILNHIKNRITDDYFRGIDKRNMVIDFGYYPELNSGITIKELNKLGFHTREYHGATAKKLEIKWEIK